MKKLIVHSVVFLTMFNVCRVLGQEQVVFDQKNTIILCDLNGVIIKSDKSAMLSEFWQCTHKGNIFWNVISTCIHLARTIGLRKTCFEEIIQECKPVNPALADLLSAMSCCQKIIPGTAAIMEELHVQGYTMAIASNIGIKSFEKIKKNNEPFFDYFSVITTADTIDPGGSLIKKPDLRFFTLFQERYNKTGKHIIFIDDVLCNVNAAKSVGIDGVLFKNPKQLHCDLRKLKLLSVA